MRKFKIYTAGKMTGLSYDEQMGWRRKVRRAFKNRNVTVVEPPLYYQPEGHLHHKEREAMLWDLWQIRTSDIVIVDLSNIGMSIGTHMELGYAECMNQTGDHPIYIIGFGEPDVNHPWIDEVCFRRENTLEAALEYIAEYLLV